MSSFASQVVLRSADFLAKHHIWDQHWHHVSDKVITEYFGTDILSMEEISIEKLSIEMGKTGVKNEVLIHPWPLEESGWTDCFIGKGGEDGDRQITEERKRVKWSFKCKWNHSVTDTWSTWWTEMCANSVAEINFSTQMPQKKIFGSSSWNRALPSALTCETVRFSFLGNPFKDSQQIDTDVTR